MKNLNDEDTVVKQREIISPAEGASDAFREGTFEITTRAEIPVISKVARIVEEVTISKQMTEQATTIRDSIKRTTVEVNKINADDAENRGKG